MGADAVRRGRLPAGCLRLSLARRQAIRAILALRALEALAVAAGPVLATRQALIGGSFVLSDVVALTAMAGFAAALAALVWSTPGRR